MKKILILFVLVFGSTYAHAGLVACVDGLEVTSLAVDAPPIDGCLYFMSGSGMTDDEYRDLRNLMKSSQMWHLKHVSGQIVEKSTFEKTQVDSALANEIDQNERDRIDAGAVSASELMAALDDLAKDVTVTTLIRIKGELAMDKLKTRIKKVKGL